MKYIQQNLTKHIFDKDGFDDKDFNFIKTYSTSEELKERLDTHRQTIFENLVNSLKITYPCIWKLIGESCARGIALSYIHQIGDSRQINNQPGMNLIHLPKDGRAHDFGIDFPEYLKRFPSVKHLSYLKDVATLEWLKSLSYHARISDQIYWEEIQHLNEDKLYKTCFEFNDSLHLLCSCYPLLEIQAIVDDTNNNTQLSLNEENFHYYAIYQKDYLVFTVEIEESSFLFMQLLIEGNNLGNVADKCMLLFPEFNLSVCIAFIMNRGLVTKFKQQA